MDPGCRYAHTLRHLPEHSFSPAAAAPQKLHTVFYLVSGFGITAGYHRLWSHKAFEASLPARILLMLAGTAAVEGSIR